MTFWKTAPILALALTACSSAPGDKGGGGDRGPRLACVVAPLYFTDNAHMQAESESYWEQGLECLRSRRGKILIVGYASGGDSERARQQSTVYVDQIKARLVEAGIETDRIQSFARGSEDAPCDEPTPECQARLNRVEIELE